MIQCKSVMTGPGGWRSAWNDLNLWEKWDSEWRNGWINGYAWYMDQFAMQALLHVLWPWCPLQPSGEVKTKHERPFLEEFWLSSSLNSSQNLYIVGWMIEVVDSPCSMGCQLLLLSWWSWTLSMSILVGVWWWYDMIMQRHGFAQFCLLKPAKICKTTELQLLGYKVRDVINT